MARIVIKASLFASIASTFILAALPLTARADDAPAPAPAPAPASTEVTVVRAQLTDRVEGSKPVGDASSLAGAAMATYWVEASNTSKETKTITLVWTIDGKEAGKQSLDVGHSPHWKTWGSWPIKKAHAIEVKVVDAQGIVLHADSTTL